MKLKLLFIIPLSGLLNLSVITPANTNAEQTLENTLKNPKVQLGLGIAGGALAGTGLGVGLYKLNQMNALKELQYKYYKARLEHYRDLENKMNEKPLDYNVDDKLYAQKKWQSIKKKSMRLKGNSRGVLLKAFSFKYYSVFF